MLTIVSIVMDLRAFHSSFGKLLSHDICNFFIPDNDVIKLRHRN